ncbi:MAG TPA: putative sugar O-methyltransferase, partial [Spirochaetia bacterium]|nr:putative sugar O-methyltransferase [Spirochaetia bacterium]
EKKIDRFDHANYLEIGSGSGVFASSLARCFDRKLRVFLIDLPTTLLNAAAYLTCTAGSDHIGLVTEHTDAAVEKPFVCISNYLVPEYERFLPEMDLVHNALSFNEMNPRQVAYYYDLVARHMTRDGFFQITGGTRGLAYHVDAAAMALRRFPYHDFYRGSYIAGCLVDERLNTVIRYPFNKPRSWGGRASWGLKSCASRLSWETGAFLLSLRDRASAALRLPLSKVKSILRRNAALMSLIHRLRGRS